MFEYIIKICLYSPDRFFFICESMIRTQLPIYAYVLDQHMSTQKKKKKAFQKNEYVEDDTSNIQYIHVYLSNNSTLYYSRFRFSFLLQNIIQRQRKEKKPK